MPTTQNLYRDFCHLGVEGVVEKQEMPKKKGDKNAASSAGRKPIRPIDRMKMRPWLVELLDSERTTALQWVEKDKLIFQVSWRHAAQHGWTMEKDGDIFERWARHTGKFVDGDNPDPKRWKANFRCALHSLPDVVELQGKRKGQNACRIYQFLNNPVIRPPKTKSVSTTTNKRKGSKTEASVKRENNVTSSTDDGSAEQTSRSPIEINNIAVEPSNSTNSAPEEKTDDDVVKKVESTPDITEEQPSSPKIPKLNGSSPAAFQTSLPLLIKHLQQEIPKKGRTSGIVRMQKQCSKLKEIRPAQNPDEPLDLSVRKQSVSQLPTIPNPGNIYVPVPGDAKYVSVIPVREIKVPTANNTSPNAQHVILRTAQGQNLLAVNVPTSDTSINPAIKIPVTNTSTTAVPVNISSPAVSEAQIPKVVYKLASELPVVVQEHTNVFVNKELEIPTTASDSRLKRNQVTSSLSQATITKIPTESAATPATVQAVMTSQGKREVLLSPKDQDLHVMSSSYRDADEAEQRGASPTAASTGLNNNMKGSQQSALGRLHTKSSVLQSKLAEFEKTSNTCRTKSRTCHAEESSFQSGQEGICDICGGPNAKTICVRIPMGAQAHDSYYHHYFCDICHDKVIGGKNMAPSCQQGWTNLIVPCCEHDDGNCESEKCVKYSVIVHWTVVGES